MTLPVTLRREVTADFQSLPSEALRAEALRYLVLLKERPQLGLMLKDHPVLGNLSDCRKVYFDEGQNRSPRYRIVYRLAPDEARPTSVDVIVIGPRADAAVYFEASRRLGRAAG